MRTIWKYTLKQSDMREMFTVAMPQGAKPLTVQMQDGRPCIWFEIPVSTAPVETLTFGIFGTGNPLDVPEKYIGTFQMPNLGLVWHLYQCTA